MGGHRGFQPKALGRVERLVGSPQDLVRHLILPEVPDANTHPDRRDPWAAGLPDGDLEVVELARDQLGLGLSGLRQRHDELIAAESRQDIRLAQAGLQLTGDLPEEPITRLMAELVL